MLFALTITAESSVRRSLRDVCTFSNAAGMRVRQFRTGGFPSVKMEFVIQRDCSELKVSLDTGGRPSVKRYSWN